MLADSPATGPKCTPKPTARQPRSESVSGEPSETFSAFRSAYQQSPRSNYPPGQPSLYDNPSDGTRPVRQPGLVNVFASRKSQDPGCTGDARLWDFSFSQWPQVRHGTHGGLVGARMCAAYDGFTPDPLGFRAGDSGGPVDDSGDARMEDAWN
jgi:hypothetical protein